MSVGNLRDGDHWKHAGVDGRIILTSSRNSTGARTDVPKDTDKLRSLVNTVVNLQVVYNARNFLPR